MNPYMNILNTTNINNNTSPVIKDIRQSRIICINDPENVNFTNIDPISISINVAIDTIEHPSYILSLFL